MMVKIFNPKKFEKLNDPIRLEHLPPVFIKEKLEIQEAKVIVDVGAGTGFFSLHFANMFHDSKVYACDISDFMVNYMKDKVVPVNPRIHPLLMEHDTIPLGDGLADLIVMINLHHEIEDPEKILLECYRLLKPGGKIAISDWKKEDTGHGPALEIRFETGEVEVQLAESGFIAISSFDELKLNFLVIGEKPSI